MVLVVSIFCIVLPCTTNTLPRLACVSLPFKAHKPVLACFLAKVAKREPVGDSLSQYNPRP